MEVESVVEYMIQAMLGGVGIWAITVLQQMKTSIDHLNENVAKLIEKGNWHEKTLDSHEERLLRLERIKGET